MRLVWLRTGLILLTAVQGGLGLWTQFFPRSFYDDVPTVDAYPPFSEHVLRDFGGATLGIAVALGAAAIYLERRLVVTALLGYLAFAVPHLVFHLGHLDHMPTGDALFLAVSLVVMTVLPLPLLLLARRSTAHGKRNPVGGQAHGAP
ncbi:hypothetical protein ACIHCQ_02115 [Streptomyces sp. NPDC052236]|uniref:hypothetical protein n=1 Tax=Streptomyces sp. NPDC052236 TaxID=3365686 RepID=UPI0037D2E470